MRRPGYGYRGLWGGPTACLLLWLACGWGRALQAQPSRFCTALSVARAEAELSAVGPLPDRVGVAHVSGSVVWLEEAAWLAQLPCVPGRAAAGQWRDALLQVLRELNLDPQLLVVLTTEPSLCAELSYLPVANDVAGIGYQHGRARARFDESPGRRLEGIVFLNDWRYWQPRPEEFARAFSHEVAHRWGMRVHAQLPGEPDTLLLGRTEEHWSYYADTGGSPLEGNQWVDQGDFFVAATTLGGGDFTPLDLYLMGVLPAEAVPPVMVLRQPFVDPSLRDCLGRPLTAASPPQFCMELSVSAEPLQVTLQDVIAAEGPRDPPAEDQVIVVDVVLLVVDNGFDASRVTQCLGLAQTLTQRLQAFERQSAGRVVLRNLLSASPACPESPGGSAPVMPAASTEGRSCAIVGPPGAAAGPHGARWILCLTGLWLCLRRRGPPSGGARVDVLGGGA